MADGAGRGGQARRMIDKVLPQHCMPMQSGHGTKGTREYGCARLGVQADDTPGGYPDGVAAGSRRNTARRFVRLPPHGVGSRADGLASAGAGPAGGAGARADGLPGSRSSARTSWSTWSPVSTAAPGGRCSYDPTEAATSSPAATRPLGTARCVPDRTRRPCGRRDGRRPLPVEGRVALRPARGVRLGLARRSEPGPRGVQSAGRRKPRTVSRSYRRPGGGCLLSRHGARCRCCHRSVSPCRSPNPAYPSPSTGLSTDSAVQAWLRRVQGLGIVLPL